MIYDNVLHDFVIVAQWENLRIMKPQTLMSHTLLRSTVRRGDLSLEQFPYLMKAIALFKTIVHTFIALILTNSKRIYWPKYGSSQEDGRCKRAYLSVLNVRDVLRVFPK